MGLLSFSADDLLKLPLVRTMVSIVTIILCVCPGVYIMYLYDIKMFNEMNIFKLLLITLSMNILFYLGSFTIILVLTVFESLPAYILHNSDVSEDSMIRIRESIEKSIIITNFTILIGIAVTMIMLQTGQNTFTYVNVLGSFKSFSYYSMIGWFGPSTISKYLQLLGKKKNNDNPE